MGTLSSEFGLWRAAQASGPLVYADANVPVPLIGFMRQRLSWDVLPVIEEPDWRRASDVAHFRRARELARTLVTLDRDFIDDRRFPPGESGGVIVLSGPDDRALQRLLRDVDPLLRTSSRPLPLAGRKLLIHPGWTAGHPRVPA